ncbi:hypothetical protein AAHA92_12603 [Salvia divinorum]|uniref:Secreted protein n=1 Tax=Salvia divinorum TaxID=28513 RepID=A0ABD1HPY3_SALDI
MKTRIVTNHSALLCLSLTDLLITLVCLKCLCRNLLMLQETEAALRAMQLFSGTWHGCWKLEWVRHLSLEDRVVVEDSVVDSTHARATLSIEAHIHGLFCSPYLISAYAILVCAAFRASTVSSKAF